MRKSPDIVEEEMGAIEPPVLNVEETTTDGTESTVITDENTINGSVNLPAQDVIDHMPLVPDEEVLHDIKQQSVQIDRKENFVKNSPVHIVGAFLGYLFEGHTLPLSLSDSPQQRTLYSPVLRTMSFSSKREFSQSLHYCPNFSQGELIRTIIGLYSTVTETMVAMQGPLRGIPECFDIVRCQSTTSEEELRLFFNRASQYPRLYIVLEVNKLPYKAQEVSLLIPGAHEPPKGFWAPAYT